MPAIFPENKNEDFAPGDEVVIHGLNKGMPGGSIHNGGGVRVSIDTTKLIRIDEKNYWYVEKLPHWDIAYVFHVSQFKKKEAAPARKDAPILKEEKRVEYDKLLLDDLRKEAVKMKINTRGIKKVDLLRMVNESIAAKKEAEKPPIPEWQVYGLDFMKRYNSLAKCTLVGYECVKDMKEAHGRHYYKGDSLRAPCHASLSSTSGPWQYFHQAPHKDFLEQDGYKEWVEYWLNDSPLSFAVLTKTWEDANKYGVVLDSSKLTVSGHAVFGIGLREGNEFYHKRCPLFKRLIKDKVHPRIAWFLSCNLRIDEENVLKNSFWSGAHQVHNAAFTWNPFVKFLQEGKMLIDGEVTADKQNGAFEYKVSQALGKNPGWEKADEMTIAKHLTNLHQKYPHNYHGLMIIAGYLTQEIFG